MPPSPSTRSTRYFPARMSPAWTRAAVIHSGLAQGSFGYETPILEVRVPGHAPGTCPGTSVKCSWGDVVRTRCNRFRVNGGFQANARPGPAEAGSGGVYASEMVQALVAVEI